MKNRHEQETTRMGTDKVASNQLIGDYREVLLVLFNKIFITESEKSVNERRVLLPLAKRRKRQALF